MSARLKGIGRKIIERFGNEVSSIDGAISLLEKMASEEVKKSKKSRLRQVSVLNDQDFNTIYDSVLNYICIEEQEKSGPCKYRKKLDAIDGYMDTLTREARLQEEIPAAERELKHDRNNSPNYQKPEFHSPFPIINTRDVPYIVTH